MAHFVGIGLGAIQSGLFVREAYRTGAFASLAIAARRRPLVDAINTANALSINTAHDDGVVAETFDGVHAFAIDAPDRSALVAALARASEIAIAVSSVDDYATGGPLSIDALLADAIAIKLEQAEPAALIYTAENHHHAAALLERAILTRLSDDMRASALTKFQTVDTVIGKMSRVVVDPAEMVQAGLMEAAPGTGRAFLVEAFNRIQISPCDRARTSGRTITIFEEAADLTPYEHAKLHGHNATHALLAYFGLALGKTWISDVFQMPQLVALARSAFVNESGATLRRMHAGRGPLFTETGYAAYVDDLLKRMANPHLRDTCGRIGRDVERKLGWDDRLIGTIRQALREGIEPTGYTLGALAAVRHWKGHTNDLSPLLALWDEQGANPEEAEQVYNLLTVHRANFRKTLDALA